MKKPFFILLLVILLTACASREEIVYYQNSDDVSLEKIEAIYTHPIIQVNNILDINVASKNPQSIAAYTKKSGLPAQNQQIQLLKLDGYLVNVEGEINFPELGKIKVSGLTTQEAQTHIESKLKPFIRDATVSVRILNNAFTIEGEVLKPGTFEVLDERITLNQAIAMAGGLGIRARRDNIKIFRQYPNSRKVKTIDLTSTEWMNTEFYYINPNDLIYVEPNNPQIKSAGFITNVGTLLSVFSILLSTTVLLLR